MGWKEEPRTTKTICCASANIFLINLYNTARDFSPLYFLGSSWFIFQQRNKQNNFLHEDYFFFFFLSLFVKMNKINRKQEEVSQWQLKRTKWLLRLKKDIFIFSNVESLCDNMTYVNRHKYFFFIFLLFSSLVLCVCASVISINI